MACNANPFIIFSQRTFIFNTIIAYDEYITLSIRVQIVAMIFELKFKVKRANYVSYDSCHDSFCNFKRSTSVIFCTIVSNTTLESNVFMFDLIFYVP